MSNKLEIFFDGGNEKGIAVYGVTAIAAGKTVFELGGIVDQSLEQTNNVAEWYGMRASVILANSQRDFYDNFVIMGDSELVIKQMKGEYAIKKVHLMPIASDAKITLHSLLTYRDTKTVDFKWIPRERNERADQLGHLIRNRYLGT